MYETTMPQNDYSCIIDHSTLYSCTSMQYAMRAAVSAHDTASKGATEPASAALRGWQAGWAAGWAGWLLAGWCKERLPAKARAMRRDTAALRPGRPQSKA